MRLNAIASRVAKTAEIAEVAWKEEVKNKVTTLGRKTSLRPVSLLPRRDQSYASDRDPDSFRHVLSSPHIPKALLMKHLHFLVKRDRHSRLDGADFRQSVRGQRAQAAATGKSV